jgi:EAL domain-containing protein (putative c-di-GMP-specific phosphodiesterase class I)
MSEILGRHIPASPSHRDRFVAFAFAVADLLVETQPDGTVTYAAGTFKARFGREPESYLGSPIEALVTPADRCALALGLTLLRDRGRLAPVVLRLNDAARSPMGFAGLALPGRQPRLCITFSRLAYVPPGGDTLDPPVSFAESAEARLRTGVESELGMIEVRDWANTKSAMPPEVQRTLQAEITETLARIAGPGGMAAEMAEGRYGVLGGSALDLAALGSQLEQLIRKVPGGKRARVDSTGLTLAADGLTGPQAARALRFALSKFAQGGAEATAEAGFDNGLAGFITLAEQRARAVRSAIAERRFRLAFQPIVSLATRAVHHFEALIRPIPTPGSPVRSTQEFVTFAEAVGLSEELDTAVLEEAIAAARSSHVPIAVNVSGISMESRSFCSHALSLLKDPALAGRILIEMTETADIAEPAQAIETVNRLREHDVRVCIDDFGAGSAAFRYLRDFQVDYVKIDGGYVRRAPDNAREHGFIVSMIDLANLVGARVVAEMIETEEQASLMQAAGVEFGQGWLFGKPGSLPGTV